MHSKRKTITGIVISTLFLVLIFHNVNFAEMIETFKDFQLQNLVTIIAIYAFSLLVRAVRWSFLLQADKRFSLYQLGSTWVIGNLMNAFLPARAGDIWRAYEVGLNTKESKMKIFGSVMLERIMDGVSVCTILYFCVLMYANLTWLRKLANWSMLLFGGSLLAFYLLVKFDKVQPICEFLVRLVSSLQVKYKDVLTNFVSKVCHHIKLFVSGFEVFKSGYYSSQALIMSFCTWILEILITYWVITSFGVKCPISAAMFVICFIALGAMIPSGSIFVGPYQYAYILALGLYFIPKSEALAIAFVHQTILMGSLLFFSGVFVVINALRVLISGRAKRKSQEEQKVLQEV